MSTTTSSTLEIFTTRLQLLLVRQAPRIQTTSLRQHRTLKLDVKAGLLNFKDIREKHSAVYAKHKSWVMEYVVDNSPKVVVPTYSLHEWQQELFFASAVVAFTGVAARSSKSDPSLEIYTTTKNIMVETLVPDTTPITTIFNRWSNSCSRRFRRRCFHRRRLCCLEYITDDFYQLESQIGQR